MNFLKLAVAILLIGPTAQAFNIDAKIIKVNKDASKVIVSTQDTSNVKVGDFLSLGTSCELEVVKVPKDDRILLDGSICEETKFLTKDRSIILMGQDGDSRIVAASSNVTRTERIARPVDMTGVVSRGFRLSTSFADADYEEESSFGSYIITADGADKFSLGLGYANIGVRRLGFLGSLTYSYLDTVDINSLRASASAVFGFNKKIYGYLGTNLNFFTDSGYNDLDPELGTQFGLGFQFNELIGLSLARVNTINSDSDFDIDVFTNATELGMTLTF